MREKLIELIREVQYLGGLEEKVADHLIANGVMIPVRCNDCKRFCKYEQSSRNHCALSGRFVGEDDFCSFGEEGQPKQWERESDHEKL